MDVLARRLLLNVVPLGMIFVMAYVTVFGANGLMARHRMQDELGREQRRLADVLAEDARLRREVKDLSGDPLTLQRAAAEDLQLVPAGSTVYRFAQPLPAAAPPDFGAPQ